MGVRAARSMRAAVVLTVAVVVVAAGGSPAQAAGPVNPVFRVGPDILDSTGVSRPTPVQIDGLAGIDIVQTSANDDHILALSSGGQVYAWGENFEGQLGNGTTDDSDSPVLVPLPAGVGTVIQVVAGSALSVAVTSTGKVLTWGTFPGDGSPSPHLTPTVIALPRHERAAFISANEDFVEYVTRGGAVWGWGVNDVGQMGNGHVGVAARPVRAHLPAHFVARSVATGVEHSLALGIDTRTGRTEVLAWGANFDGQLGDPGVHQSLVPVVVQMPAGAAAITSISAGGVGSGAVDALGTAYSWGGNDAIADQEAPTVVALPAGVRATSISSGTQFSLVTTSSNQVYGWGLNRYGALGPDIGLHPSLTDVPMPAGTIAAAAHNLETTYVITHQP